MSKRIISIVAIVALVAVLGVCLVACGKDAESFTKKLEKAGYTVEQAGDEDLAMLQSFGIDFKIEWVIEAKKGTDEVTVMCFAEKDMAKAFETMLNMTAGTTGIKAEVDGKILYAGTAQGIKDAK